MAYSADPPPNLWRADPRDVPAGNYVYLAGDSSGVASSFVALYTESNSLTRVSRSVATLAVSVSGADPRSGVFLGTDRMTELAAGYYESRGGVPYRNPSNNGLFTSPDLAGCAALHGWYIIDSIVTVRGVVLALDLRFEETCARTLAGGSAELHGQIHWRA